jgi:tRNA pseudouridine55 synthase
MSKRRSTFPWRAVDGILLLDKPRGLSSNQALQEVRRLFAAEKGGHTGALDPLATGLLPLCFGETTKVAGLLLSERKAYETVARFGIETDTCDADGVETARADVPLLAPERVGAELATFLGRIRQVPPIYSALKRDGEALYAKARRGEVVEVEARDIDVHAIELVELGPDTARLRIVCGSGTYIRSLVRDLGRRLGCGAHVAELRRLWVDPFRSPRMYTLAEIEEAAAGGPSVLERMLLPIEAGLAGLRAFPLEPEEARRLGQGQRVARPGAGPDGEGVALDIDGRALGLVLLEHGELRPKRLFRRGLEAVAASR